MSKNIRETEEKVIEIRSSQVMWFLIVIIAIFFIVFLIKFNHKLCPESCNDSNNCTIDKCSSETKFICSNELIDKCCISDNDCSIDTPFCYFGKCSESECLSSNDCNEDYPYCLSGKCSNFECKKGSDCPKAKPWCRNYECNQNLCDSNKDCEDFDYLYIDGEFVEVGLVNCFQGNCVECTSNDHCKTCKDKWNCGQYICKWNKCSDCKFDYECKGEFDYCRSDGLCISSSY